MAKRTTIIRSLAALAILGATIALFISYYASHPAVRHQLESTPIPLLAGLLALYCLFVGSLVLVNNATLRLSGAYLPQAESTLLTLYSSIINFFGPLQSGPAFRAVYLKTKFGVLLRNYTVATFVYYGLYAFISGLCLVSGIIKWWVVPLGVVSALIMFALISSRKGPLARLQQLDLRNWYYLLSATALQIALITIIYFVELHSILPHITVGQAIVYAGAANFALFVSLTPGAIGFRESFLVFSEKLHHVPSSAIVVANTIDRAVYITLLLLLAVGIFSSHAQRRFKITDTN